MSTHSDRIVATASDATTLFGVYRRQLLSVAVYGFAVGVIFAGCYYLLDNYVFGRVLCTGSDDMTCGRASSYAMAIAAVAAATISLVGLVQLRGYRPFLVVASTIAIFWGIDSTLMIVPWLVGLAMMGVLVALSFSLLNWVARLKPISPVILIMVVIVIIARLALLS